MTSLQVKTWFLFSHQKCVFLSKLSGNLVREVCSYLSDLVYVSVHASTLNVFNLETAQVTTKEIQTFFNAAVVCCLVSGEEVICIGGNPPATSAYIIRISTAEMRNASDMHCERGWPGVIHWRESVYVFGGNINPSIKEAERYEPAGNRWVQLPPMSSAKVAFTPLLHRGKIYLISAFPQKPVSIETFDPLKETYETMNMTIESDGYGAISFAQGDDILIVLYGGRLIRWNPKVTTFTETAIRLPDSEAGITTSPVIRYQEKVLWVNYFNGNLIQFDFRTCTVANVSTQIG